MLIIAHVHGRSPSLNAYYAVQRNLTGCCVVKTQADGGARPAARDLRQPEQGPYTLNPLLMMSRRQTAAGDQLRVIYDNLSKDPNSLSNLDQDLPNYAQHQVPDQNRTSRVSCTGVRNQGWCDARCQAAVCGLHCRLLCCWMPPDAVLPSQAMLHVALTIAVPPSKVWTGDAGLLAGADLLAASGVAVVRDVVRQHNKAGSKDYRPMQQPAHQGNSLCAG
jgi:hypothetical protein